ncbi:AI-2E family transporter [Candidatus Microgenomates bacterium]|nr:AI-2E family transporter [Candidatus Microgenomates bacterium]
MRKNNPYLIYGLGAVVIFGLLYLVRDVVMPFVLAAGFAYILNPLVTFLTHRVKVPRNLSIVIIYLILIGLLGVMVVNISHNLTRESEQFARETRVFLGDAERTISTLPDWLQPIAADSLESARTSLLYPQRRVIAFLPGAVNRTIGVLIFLVASFYFLRDGHKFMKGLFGLLPTKVATEIEIILLKINGVLGNYLRGQLLLVAIMAGLTYVSLTVIGVRYALILSIFTGFAEVIPYVGPVIAALVAMGVAFADQASRFNLVPILDVAAVGIVYFILRQFEDLFIIPQVMGRLTKLHPLVIMFAVLTGGRFFGLVGYLVAVPVVASLKVIADYFHEKAL